MCAGISEEDFVSGSRSGSYGRVSGASGDGVKDNQMSLARSRLWSQLNHLKPKVGKHRVYRSFLLDFALEFHVEMCGGGIHSYMDNSATTHLRHLTQFPMTQESNEFKPTKTVHPFVEVRFETIFFIDANNVRSFFSGLG